MSSFKASMQLNDDRFLDIVPEPWWGGPTAVMMTLFPSVILQQQVNSVSTRHIQPRGPGAFDFVWTHFGFEDDDAEMTQRRLRQANLFGPAGFVSADDGEVIERVAAGLRAASRSHRTLAELGGREVGDTEHMVTETLIRGMYAYWRERDGGSDAGRRADHLALDPALRRLRQPPSTPATGSAGPSSSPRTAATGCSRARTSTAAFRSRRCRSRARAC